MSYTRSSLSLSLRTTITITVVTDYRRTVWPSPLSSLNSSVAEFLDGLNDIILDLDDLVVATSSSIDADSANSTSTSSTNVEELSSSSSSTTTTTSSAPLLLTFSHFLPRIELLPEKRYLSLPTLHSCVGSTYLETRLRQLRRRSCIHDDDAANIMGDNDHLHAFGHSHLAWDQCIEGIRYVHVPLAYPREWEQRRRSLEIGSMNGEDSEMRLPVCIWDSSSSSSSSRSGSTPSSSSPNVGNDEGNESNTAATTTTSGFPTYWLGGWWSKYYAVMERQPHRNTELAPWAARRFR